MLDKNSTTELLKELLRTGFFAAVGAVLAYLSNVQDPSLLTVFLTVVFRAIDRGVHKSTKTKIKSLSLTDYLVK